MVESVLDSKQPHALRTSAPKQQRGIDAAACWIDRFHRENAVRTVLQSSPPYFSAALAHNCVDDDHTKGLVIDAAAKRIVENFTRSVTDLKFLASVLEEAIATACKAKLERSSRIRGMKRVSVGATLRRVPSAPGGLGSGEHISHPALL